MHITIPFIEFIRYLHAHKRIYNIYMKKENGNVEEVMCTHNCEFICGNEWTLYKFAPDYHSIERVYRKSIKYRKSYPRREVPL